MDSAGLTNSGSPRSPTTRRPPRSSSRTRSRGWGKSCSTWRAPVSLPPCEHPFETSRLNATTDYRRDWDVLALGGEITAALTKDLDAVRARPAPDPARKIHLLRGPAGYGKTHLFGRVRYE